MGAPYDPIYSSRKALPLPTRALTGRRVLLPLKPRKRKRNRALTHLASLVLMRSRFSRPRRTGDLFPHLLWTSGYCASSYSIGVELSRAKRLNTIPTPGSYAHSYKTFCFFKDPTQASTLAFTTKTPSRTFRLPWIRRKTWVDLCRHPRGQVH